MITESNFNLSIDLAVVNKTIDYINHTFDFNKHCIHLDTIQRPT